MPVTLGDHKGLIRELNRQGWTVSQTNRGHYRALPPPGGGKLVHFSTSTDPHAWRNTIKQLQQSGYRPEGQRRMIKTEIKKTKCPVCNGDFNEASGECLGSCSKEEPVDLETVWEELKRAKELQAEAQEGLTSSQKNLEEAQRTVEQSKKWLEEKTRALKAAKEKFDKKFGGT